MKKILCIALAAITIGTVGGCANKQETGALAGAAAGGLLGSRFGGGSGRLLAVGAGAVIGALIGGRIGKMMDDHDKLKMQQTFERTRTGHIRRWRNPDTGNSYAVKPTKTYYSNNRPCRNYVMTAWINGQKKQVHGRACRQPNGVWKVA